MNNPNLIKTFIYLMLYLVHLVQGNTIANPTNLLSTIQNASPGDTIILDDGIYDKTILIKKNASIYHPLVIKAKNFQKAIFTNTVTVEGSHIILSELLFTGENPGGLLILDSNSSYCKITRCTWFDSHGRSVSRGSRWLQVGGIRHEISYNLFENKSINPSLSSHSQVLSLRVSDNPNDPPEKHWVHHNHFKDIPRGGGNGFETLQIIANGNPYYPKGSCQTIIEYNIFERCNGEGEIISNKSNDNIFRYNKFIDSNGGLVFRTGYRNTAYGNYFTNCAFGVRFTGINQSIHHNYFENITKGGVAIMKGTHSDVEVKEGSERFKDGTYSNVIHARIKNNTFVNCENDFLIALTHKRTAFPETQGVHPIKVTLANNLFYGNFGQAIKYHSGFSNPISKHHWIIKGNLCDNNRTIGELNSGGISKVSLKDQIIINTDGLITPKPEGALINTATPLENLTRNKISELSYKHKIDYPLPPFHDVGAIQTQRIKSKNYPTLQIIKESQVGPLAKVKSIN